MGRTRTARPAAGPRAAAAAAAGAAPAVRRAAVRLIAIAAAAVWLTGCAATSPAPTARGQADRLCALRGAPAAPGPPARAAAQPQTPRRNDRPAADALVAAGWSRRAVEVAEVIGALDLLRRLDAERRPGAPGAGTRARAIPARPPAAAAMAAELRALRLRQAIGDRITAAMLDVSATLAEIDCEGERGDQLQARLQTVENRRTRRLTIASILVGALTAGVTGGLNLAGAAGAELAGIVGGASEATLGAALLTGQASGDLPTPRNMLGELWRRPARSALFPETVWRYLTRPGTAGEGEGGAIADVIIAEWRQGDRLGAPGSAEERERAALLFGEGGRYTVDDLEVREALLELLETSVGLMARDLRTLLAELKARAPDDDAP